MGRHSSEQQWAFYRSVAGWLIPWALVAGVAIIAVFIAVDALGGGSDDAPPVVAQASPSPSPSAAVAEASPAPSPRVKPQRQKKKDKPSPSPKPTLITEDISVQVLNGSGSPDAATLMADRLAQLGFQVYAVDGASTAYPATTVFWSYEEARPAAEALAAKYGWEVGPKPSNLSTSVAMHIVVGDDEG